MKSFLEKSKKSLVLLLTAAMIFTSVPMDTFAAAAASADDEVIVEEAVEEVVTNDVASSNSVLDEEVSEETGDSVDYDLADTPDRILKIVTSHDGLGGATDITAGDKTLTAGVVGTDRTNTLEIDAQSKIGDGGTFANTNDVVWHFQGSTKTTPNADTDSDWTDLWVSTSPEDVTNMPGSVAPTVSGSKFTIASAPETVAVSGKYRILITDSGEETTEKGNKDKDGAHSKILTWAINGPAVTLNGTTATIGASANIALQAVTNTNEVKIASGTKDVFEADLSTGTKSAKYATQGYTVLATTPDDNTIDNVKPVTYKLSSTLGVDYAIDDITAENITFEGDGADSFKVTKIEGTSLYNGHDVKITVEPKDALVAKASNLSDGFTAPTNYATAGDGTSYKADLVINSAKMGKVIVPVAFFVVTDLGMTAKKGTEDIEETANVFDFGKVKVGETVENWVVTSKGGNGNPGFTELVNGLPNGLTVKDLTTTAGTLTTPATYEISGQVKASTTGGATNVGTYTTNRIYVEDKDGNASLQKAVKVIVEGADVSYELDGVNKDDADASYIWYGLPTKSATVDGTPIELVVKNNSAVDLTIADAQTTGGLTPAGTLDSNITFTVTGTKTIAAGESTTLTITPKSSAAMIASKYGRTKLTISGNGIADKAFELAYVVNNDATVLVANDTMDKATVGKYYSFNMQYTGTKGNNTWKVANSTDAVTSAPEGYTKVTSDTLLDEYGITFNTTTGIFSGTPKKAGKVTVHVDLNGGTSPDPTGKNVSLEIAAAAVTAITVTDVSTSKDIADKGALSYGNVAYDLTTEAAKTLRITNNSATDFTVTPVITAAGIVKTKAGATVTLTDAGVTRISNGNQIAIADLFYVTVVDENGDEKKDGTGVITVPAGESYTLTLTRKAPNGDFPLVYNADTADAIKEYNVTLTLRNSAAANASLGRDAVVANSQIADYTLVAKYVLKAAPSILDPGSLVEDAAFDTFLSGVGGTALNGTANAAGIDYMQVGVDIDNTGTTAAPKKYLQNHRFNAVDAEKKNLDSSKGDVTFTWANAPDSELDIDYNKSGIRLASTGEIEGKPKVAGVYDVIVTATLKDGSIATREQTLRVLPAARLKVTYGATTTSIVGKVYVLPGVVEGATGTKLGSGVAIHVQSDAAVSGLKVTVEDADTRTKAQIKKGEANKALGSTSFIGINGSAITSDGVELPAIALAGGSVDFNVTPLKATAPGRYVAKVTIGSDATDDASFYVEFNVVEELQIAQPADTNLNASVGNKYKLPLEANGGYQVYKDNGDLDASKSQAVTWSEVSTTKDTDGTTPLYFATTSGNAETASGTTDLKLQKDTDDLNYVIGGTLADKYGIPKKTAGPDGTAESKNYKIRLKATVAEGDFTNTATDRITGGALATYDEVEILGGNLINISKSLPAQEATVDFNLSIRRNEEVSIVALSTDTTPANESKLTGTIDGTLSSDGETYLSYRGYTFKGTSAGQTAETIHVLVKNASDVTLANGEASLKDESDYFTITQGSIATPASGATVTNLTVTPNVAKAKVAGTTYTDTLVIKADGIKDVELALSYTPENEKYNVAAEYTKDDETIGLVYNEVNKETGEETGREIINTFDLGAIVKGGEMTAQTFTIANTGNIPIVGGQFSVYESDSTGKAVDTAKLTITAGTTPTAIGAEAKDWIVVPKGKQNTLGINTTYLTIQYHKVGTTIERKVIPVAWSVYNSNVTGLTVDPTAKQVFGTTAGTAEGYDPTTLSKSFTFENTNEGIENSVYGIEVKFTGANPEAFVISTENENAKVEGNVLKLSSLGKDALAFSVRPRQGLDAAKTGTTYNAKVEVSGINFGSITRELEFKVVQSADYSSEPIWVDDAVAVDIAALPTEGTKLGASTAARIYNTLVKGKALVPTNTTNAANIQYLPLNLTTWTTTSPDVIIVFAVDNKADVAHVTGASIVKANDKAISGGSYTLSLNATQIGLAGDSVIDDGTNKGYFEKLTFNIYSTVEFRTGKDAGTYIVNSAEELTGDYVGAHTDATYVIDTETVTKVDWAMALVQNSKAVSSAFAEGVWPVAADVAGEKTFAGWDVNGEILSADTTVSKNVVATPRWQSFNYSTDKNDATNVKWTWEEDGADGWSAYVTFYPLNPSASDPTAGVLTYTVKTAPKVYISRKVEKATCDKGARNVYTASITFNGTTFSTADVEQNKEVETGAALGHAWLYNDLAWAKNETTGEVTAKVTAYCDNDPSHVVTYDAALTYEDTVPAKATTVGKRTYTATYKELDPKCTVDNPTYLTTTKTETKDYEIEALGHDYVAVVSGFDEETRKATVTVTDNNDPDVAAVTYENVQFAEGVVSEDGTKTTYKATIELPDKTSKEIEHVVTLAVYTVKSSNITWNPYDLVNHVASAKVTVVYTVTASDGTSKEETVEETVAAKADGEAVNNEQLYKLTYTTLDKNAAPLTDTKTYNILTGDEVISHDVHTWSADVVWDEIFDFEDPTVVITYTCAEGGEKQTFTVEVTKSAPIVRKGNTYYELTLSTTDPSGKAVTDKRYVDSTGNYVDKSAIGPENPEFEATKVWNLFYTDTYKFEVDSDIEITGAFTGTDKGSFFKVTGEAGSYEVSYIGDAKKRKSAASKTTFSAPAKWSVDGEDVTGTFQITVPTEYVKPALKLSTAKANFYTVGEKEQIVGTTVLVQDEVGNYQSMSFDDYNIDVTDSKMFGYNGTAKFNETASYPESGYLAFTATAKSNGKITIQGENWVEPVALQFNVVEVKKHSLTFAGKNSYTLTMNSTTPDLVSTIYPQMDGTWLSDFDEMPALTVTPKKSGGPNVTFDDTTGAIVITNADDEGKAIATKGSFTYEITDPNSSKLKLTVKVTDKALTAKDVTLKVKQKMNLITGQSLVLNASLKNVNGYISSVELMDDPEKSKFEVYGGSNIYVTPK